VLVLFDNGTPRTLARYLIDHHAVTEARARGWDELGNGALLNAAEAAGFDVLVTTDKNLSYQQNDNAGYLLEWLDRCRQEGSGREVPSTP
jgi:hypothetical protein